MRHRIALTTASNPTRVTSPHALTVRELPTVAVGVVGCTTAVVLHRALPAGAARAALWSAIAMGVFALEIDLAGWPRVLSPYEEGFEVLAEALYAAVLLGLRTPR